MSFEFGLCYLGLVGDICHLMGFSQESVDLEIVRAARVLGRLPRIPDLLDYLKGEFSYAMSIEVADLQHVGGFTMHYPGDGVMMLCDFIDYYSSFEFHFVGSGKPVQVDPRKILAGFGLESSELAQKALRMTVPVEAVNDLLAASITGEIKKMVDVHRYDRKIRIPFTPTTDVRRILESSYAHYTMEYRGGSAQHDYAAASRIVEIEEILGYLNYSNNNPPQKDWQAHIIDVGGNWLTHFDKGRRYIHSDSPILGANDARRASDRKNRLRMRTSFTDTQLDVLKNATDNADVLSTVCPLFCLRKGENCGLRAPACMFVHSVYDMTCQDIANTMDRHHSFIGYGTFIFAPEILVSLDVGATGYIPVYDVRWTIEVQGRRKVIRFAFVNDASYNYTHDLNEYLSLVINKQLTSRAGKTYMIEMLNNINATQYFKITRVDVCSGTAEILTHSWWLKDEEVVSITYYVLDSRRFKLGHRRLLKRTMTVSSSFLTPLMQFATRSNEIKFTVQDIYSYACAMSSRIIINGTTVTARTDDFARDVDYRLLDLVQFVYVTTYEKKYEYGLVIQNVMDEIKNERTRSTKTSILSILVNCIWKKIKDVVQNALYSLADFFIGSFVQRNYGYLYGIVDREIRFTSVVNVMTSGRDQISGITHENIDRVVDCQSIYFCESALYDNMAGGMTSDALDVIRGTGRAMCLEPEADLVIVPATGDGHCQFHAINLCMGKTFETGLELRRYYAAMLGAPKVLSTNEWGDEDTLTFIACSAKVRFCVHLTGKMAAYEEFRVFGNSGPIYHLRYSGDHYDALLPCADITVNSGAGPIVLDVSGQGGPPLSVPAILPSSVTETDIDNHLALTVGETQKEAYKNVIMMRLRILQKVFQSLSLVGRAYAANTVETGMKSLLDSLQVANMAIRSGPVVLCRHMHALPAPYVTIDHNSRDYISHFPRNPTVSHQLRSERLYMKDVVDIMEAVLKTANYTLPTKTISKVAKDAVKEAVQAQNQVASSVALSAPALTDITPAVKTPAVPNRPFKEVHLVPRNVENNLPALEGPKKFATETTEPSLDSVSLMSGCSQATAVSSTFIAVTQLRRDIKECPDDLYLQHVKAFKPKLPEDCMNRSQAKLRDVLSTLQLRSTDSLDLCSGPGGFVLELASICRTVQCVFYGNAEKGAIKHKKIDTLSNVHQLRVTETNDVADPVFLRFLPKVCADVDLVTADGCLHIDNTLDPENDNFRLISNECAAGLVVLREGGSMIVKMFDLIQDQTRQMVRSVAVNFNELRLIRSKFSSLVGGEIYVCFLGKRAYPDYNLSEKYRKTIRDFTRRNNAEMKRNLTTLRGNIMSSQVERGAPVSKLEAKRIDDWVTTQAVTTLPEFHVEKFPTTGTKTPPLIEKKEESERLVVNAESFKSLATDFIGVTYSHCVFPGLGVVARHADVFEVKSQAYLMFVMFKRVEQLIDWADKYFGFNVTISVLNGDFVFPTVKRHHYIIHRDDRLPTTTHARVNGGGIELSWAQSNTYQEYWKNADDSYEVDLGIPKSREVYCRNAVRECREQWLISKQSTYNKYFHFFSRFIFNVFGVEPQHVKGIIKHCADSGEDFGIIKNNVYIVRPVEMEYYEKGFDGENFVQLTYKNGLITSPEYKSSGYILVGKSTKLMQGDKMLLATKKFDPFLTYVPDITLRNGVPGCGKTKYILDRVTPDDFILTTTRENKEDIMSRCPHSVKDRVKTVHSVIINSKPFIGMKITTLFIDEALMSHAGELMIAITLLRPKSVHMSGDERQIPFINRTAAITMKFKDAIHISNSINYANVSYRVPKDVALLFNPSYKSGFTTQNNTQRSLSYIIVKGLYEVPKDCQVLVFKQAEKAQLKLEGYNVSTVHEYQGKQATRIALYRHSTIISDQIYASDPHILVSLTRHSKNLVYYTRIRDKICDMIDEASKFLDSDLISKEMGGGAITGLMVPNTRYAGPDYSHLLEYGLSFDVPRYQLVKNVYDVRRVKYSKVYMHKVTPNIQLLQQWYDTILPGASLPDRTYDNYLINNDPLSVTVAGAVTLDLSKTAAKTVKYDFMRPVLRTSMGLERARSQRETLLAYIKRNDAVPVPIDPVDPEFVVSMMLEKFKGYFDPDTLKNCTSVPINLTSESILQWTQSQDKSVDLSVDRYLTECDLSRFNYMIKTRPKPDMTHQSSSTYAALQTIAYQPTSINQLICPVIRDLKERVLCSLLPRFKIFSDVTIEEFAARLNEIFPFGFDPTSIIYEFDVSKYDKSQGEVALLFDAAVMRMFGVAEELVQLWIASHTTTDLIDYGGGLRARVIYQRKSGDPMTFLGNTLFLMACMSLVIPLEMLEFAAFGGDDQILVTKWILDLTSVEYFEQVFNLEVKLFQRKYPYFCSKFLIFAGGRWRFLPDLLKTVTKLGRHDLRNLDHVEEYRVSMADLFTVYNDYTLVPTLNDAFNERYPSVLTDHTHVVELLMTLFKSPAAFNKLYYSHPEDRLCNDPSRPDISQM